MRTFTLGSGPDRKSVSIEVDGPQVKVIEGRPDGSRNRTRRVLETEAKARLLAARMASELLGRGYVEQAASESAKARAASKSSSRASGPVGANLDDLLEEDPAAVAAPALPRLATASATDPADGAPRKKKKKKKSGRKGGKPQGEDGLDKRVIAGAALAGAALLALVGFFIYDAFLKKPSIIGDWKGSRTEHEIGRFLAHTEYHLVLDDQKHAALTLQDGETQSGTYTVKGDRLNLKLRSEEGDPAEIQYKIELDHATLSLYDPSSGKKLVELVRQRGRPSSGKKAAAPEAPKDLAAGPADPAADAKLASVAFSPRDGAFKVKHPPGWEAETGSRPDNTYSWARFTRGSAKIQVYADVAGSLMSGSDSARPTEEGSPLAPVHRAHELYKRTISEEFGSYSEGAPVLFKGSDLGEGRIAAFSATESGFLGGKVKGFRVTLLTNDRRITVLCQCPTAELEKLKPTFLAVARSVSN